MSNVVTESTDAITIANTIAGSWTGSLRLGLHDRSASRAVQIRNKEKAAAKRVVAHQRHAAIDKELTAIRGKILGNPYPPHVAMLGASHKKPVIFASYRILQLVSLHGVIG
jgi:hypothetical protein